MGPGQHWFRYVFNPADAISWKQLSKTPTFVLDAVDSLEPLVLLVKFLPEISGVFKHSKHHPVVTALLISKYSNNLVYRLASLGNCRICFCCMLSEASCLTWCQCCRTPHVSRPTSASKGRPSLSSIQTTAFTTFMSRILPTTIRLSLRYVFPSTHQVFGSDTQCF